jgi:spermidine synthase
LHIHIADARRFVENSVSGIYDLILVDAYGANNAPAHLTTQEFMRSLYKIVSSDGVVVGNLWRRAYNPDYDSMVLTYQSVFTQSILLNVTSDVNSIIIALAANTPINRERFAVAAGNLERKLRLRFDLETLVRSAYQPISALELNGSILLDKNVKAAP